MLTSAPVTNEQLLPIFTSGSGVLEVENGTPVFTSNYTNYKADGYYVDQSGGTLNTTKYSDSYNNNVNGTKYYYYYTKLKMIKWGPGSTTYPTSGTTKGYVVIRTPYISGAKIPYPSSGTDAYGTDAAVSSPQPGEVVSYSTTSETIS